MTLVIVEPVVNGDDNAWGTKLNTALDAIVAQINANTTSDAGKLPITGGALSGRLDAHSATLVHAALASASPITMDVAAANSFAATISGATTLAFANAAGLPVATLTGIVLRLINGGSAALTWPASVKWPGGSQPALTVAGTDLLVFTSDDQGTTWRGVLAAKDVR